MNLLSYKFWLNMRPADMTPLFNYLFIGAILFFITASAVAWMMKNRKKNSYTRLWEKLFTFFSTNLFIGLVIMFFNYEQIPFLSARFWFLIWGAGILIWIGYILKYLKTIPEKRKINEEKKEFNKYIP